MNTLQARIEEMTKWNEDNKKTLEAVNELLTALGTHTGKVVNQTFFDKHFTLSNEYRHYTKYNIYKNKQAWGKAYSIRLNRSDYGLDSRDTDHIKTVLTEARSNLEENIATKRKEIAQLTTIDEEAIKKDIIAVFNKYQLDTPTWGKLLDSYDIKYPTN